MRRTVGRLRAAVCAIVATIALAAIPATAYASDGGDGGSVTINVTVPTHAAATGAPGPGSGGLPRTGADIIGVLALAGIVLGSGVLLTVAGRRRRTG